MLGDKSDKINTPYTPKDTFDILVHETVNKTQLTEKTVQELYRDGWRYLESNGQMKWVK